MAVYIGYFRGGSRRSYRFSLWRWRRGSEELRRRDGRFIFELFSSILEKFLRVYFSSFF